MPKSHPVSGRLDPEALARVRDIRGRTRRSIGRVVGIPVGEAVGMLRCPGIAFSGGPTGRRATVAGSGIHVGEIVRLSKAGARSPGDSPG